MTLSITAGPFRTSFPALNNASGPTATLVLVCQFVEREAVFRRVCVLGLSFLVSFCPSLAFCHSNDSLLEPSVNADPPVRHEPAEPLDNSTDRGMHFPSEEEPKITT